MIGLLLDGSAMSASELARRAGVAASTASEHLHQLVAGGLVVVEARGRQRHFRIAGAEVAEGLEAMSRICPPVGVRTLRASSEAQALHFARTCYDHLAGLLGVAMLEAMLAGHWLEEAGGSCVLGSKSTGFAELGIDLGVVGRSRRPPLRVCVDWTARRPHLGGGLGAALCLALFDRGWIERAERRRGLVVTELGKRGFRETFRIDVSVLEAALEPRGSAEMTRPVACVSGGEVASARL